MLRNRKLWCLLALAFVAAVFSASYRARAQKEKAGDNSTLKPAASQTADIPEPGLILKSPSRSFEGTQGSITDTATVNFKDILKKPQIAKLKPKDGSKGPKRDGDFLVQDGDWQRPAAPIGVKPQAPNNTSKHIQPGVPSPAPSSSFLAYADDNTTIPPDPHGAVGPNHVVTATNARIRIHDRNGNTLGTTVLDTFWASLGNPNTFDPRVLYDAAASRWIMVVTANAESAASSVLIAVTTTSDPTGTWRLFRVDADSQDLVWADYPSVGFNNQWITIQVNMFTTAAGAFSRTQVYAFVKNDIYGTGNANFTLFSRADIGSTQVPAVSYDATDTQYLLQRFNSANGTLRIYTVTGPAATPTLTDTGLTPVSPINWSTSPPASATANDFASQAGNLSLLQNNDSRMQSVVLRNGSLWGTHTIFYPAGGAPFRSAVQWWQLNPTNATVQQRGVIDDTSGNTFYAFPSMAVNVNNDVLIGYSRFSLTQFVSANYAFRAGGDPANTLREDSIMKAGDGPYEKRFGGEANRWGDYSATVVDPTNGVDMWTLQEYADVPFGTGANSGRWSSWWARVRADGTVSGPATPPQTAPTATPVPGVPANDNFAAAQVISNCSGSTINNTFSATRETGEPENVSGSVGGKSIWYRWQAPATGPVNFTTEGSTFDTTLGIYTGNSVAALSLVASDDDSGPGVTSSVGFTASNGTIYYISIDGFQNAGVTPGGPTVLTWRLDNNVCAPNSVIQFTRPVYNTIEATGVAVLTVERQGSTSGAASVNYQTADGTALQRTDYTVSSGTVNFLAGEKFKTLAIPITDDAYVENTESLTVTLSSPVNGGLGSNTTATLNIINNETLESPTNPINTSRFFVRQQYADFLSREPDQAGFDYWTGELTSRTGNELTVRRREVSNAFFFELEYQQTGAYVYRLYRAAYGNNQPFPNPNPDPDNSCPASISRTILRAHLPAYANFTADRAQVRGGTELAATQLALARNFVQRAEFTARYAASLNTGAAFVDAVLATLTSINVNLSSQRTALIAQYDGAGGGNNGRAQVLYRLADDNAANPIINTPFINAEYNRAFVVTQYFGYLRRDPDICGVNFWFDIINRFPPRSAASQVAMVCAFITSGEYQTRFSPLTPRNDQECPPAP